MIDFTNLYNQYNSFWKSHNYQKAIQSLNNLNNYLGTDWSLTTSGAKLEPPALASLYAYNTQQDLNLIINQINYDGLINWYVQYLNSLIQEITDYTKQLEAQNEKNNFINAITKLIQTATFSATSILLLIGLLYIIKS